MRKFYSVTGYVTPDKLSFTQCHEHLLIRKGHSYTQNPSLYMDDLDRSTAEVQLYKQAGGSALIDAQPLGCGRMAEGLLEISQRSGVAIIASTGFHKLSFYPQGHWIFHKSEKDIRNRYIEELAHGMYNNCDIYWESATCNAKAGLIKTALDAGNFIPIYEKLFRAAAYASLETDKTIMIHVEKDSNPVFLLNYLTSLGVSPERMIFCHMDRASAFPALHEKIASAGAFLEYDTIGRFKYHSDKAEIKIINTMLKKGYENQLLCSLDTTRERLASYSGGRIGLTYIQQQFIPMMEESGITKRQITKIFSRNCIRAFCY